MKSLVDRTRICVMDVFSNAENFHQDEDQSEVQETEDEDDFNMGDPTDDERMDLDEKPLDLEDDDDYGWEMELAKVYDRTVVELGDTMGGSPIGIVTDI